MRKKQQLVDVELIVRFLRTNTNMDLYLQCIFSLLIFTIPIILYTYYLIPKYVFVIIYGIIVIIGIILPLVFHFSLTLQRAVLYLYFLGKPAEGQLRNVSNFGLVNTRNFYIKNDNISIGVWHMLPAHYTVKKYSYEDFDTALKRDEPIFMYLHGNTGSRGSQSRIDLYNILRKLGCHVIAFDYRSYGDSTYSVPHEKALVSDSEIVAKWLTNKIKSSPLFFWGHSIGTGLTTNLVARLNKSGFEANGVILEAGFIDMPSVIKVHPFGTIFRVFPWYNYLFSTPYWTNDEEFLSSKYITEFSAPVLILHAKDDHIIPWGLSKKLVEIGRQNRSNNSGEIQLKIFSATEQLGHNQIYKATKLPSIIRQFLKKHEMNPKSRSLKN